MAVQRAKRARDAAEAKLALVKKWIRHFPDQVEPMAKQLEKLQSIFVTDLPQAIAYLAQASKTLSAYSARGDAAELREVSLDNPPATDEKELS
jgi:hypothetical protein